MVSTRVEMGGKIFSIMSGTKPSAGTTSYEGVIFNKWYSPIGGIGMESRETEHLQNSGTKSPASA